MIKNHFFLLLILALFLSNHTLCAQKLGKKIENQMLDIIATQDDYPSGVVALVTADSILMLKGFGLSDIEKKIEFNPNKSLLNTASISKIITATAILQLIENRKLNLDDPVNEHIGEIKIKNPYSNKITIKELLTHTSGLSDMSIGLSSRTKEEIPLIKDYLKDHLPPVVWQPGKYYNYSNFAFTLLARIIENASGQTYQDYVRKNIFDPLKMTDSKIGGNYNDSLQMRPYKWKWYNDDSGIYLDDKGSDYFNLIGAGSFITTGKDMCHFMQAYLNKGSWGKSQILSSLNVNKMWRSSFNYDQRLPHKMGLGWHIKLQNNIKQVYHYGDGSGIETALMLLPEKNIGVFMSFNNDAENVKYRIMDSLTTHFYPNYFKTSNVTSKKTVSNSFAGIYRYMNLSQHTFEKIVYLFSLRTLKVRHKNKALFINDSKFLPIDSLLYKNSVDESWAKFITNAKGETSHLTFGYSSYIKLKWWEYPIIHQIILLIGIVLFLIIGVNAIFKFLLRKEKIHKTEHLAFNGLLIPLAFIIIALSKDNLSIDYGVSIFFYAVFTLPVLACIYFAFNSYRGIKTLKTKLKLSQRIIYIVAIILLISQLFIARYYNLIGYNFG